MSKQANLRLIGGFVIGAIALGLFLVVMVSSLDFWKNRETFVLYFSSSVNNLNVGAPVKWKGVPVGVVTDIRIRWNQDHLSADVPVFVQIDLDRLSMDLADVEVLRAEVLQGMRAQLQVESLISGLLFIELNYVPEAGEPRYVQIEQIYPEIPTVPSQFEEIGAMASSIAANLQSLDLNAINDELVKVLNRTNYILADLNLSETSGAVREAANAVAVLAGSPETYATLDAFRQAATNFANLSAKLDESAGPALADLRELTVQANQTLSKVSQAADRLNMVISPDSVLIYNLEVALTELSAAARAAKELSEFLERNPRALLTGRRPAD